MLVRLILNLVLPVQDEKDQNRDETSAIIYNVCKILLQLGNWLAVAAALVDFDNPTN